MALTTISIDPVLALIKTAQEYRGIKEEDNNRGTVPEFCNWWVIRDPDWYHGQPWCSTWVNLVGRQAVGIAWPIEVVPKYSDVDEMAKWAQQKGIWYAVPQAGDLFCVNKGTGWGHIGIVIRVMDDTERFLTIEGNTNLDGSFNGNGVYERVRTVQSCGFIRWLEAVK